MHSLWLIPSPPLFEQLQAQVEQISLEFGGPLFTPHLTLASRIRGDEGVLTKTTNNLTAKLLPLELNVLSIGMEDAFFRCLYYQIKPIEALLEARRMACDEFQLNPKAIFNPHLSLLYGQFEEAAKQAFLHNSSLKMPSTISFDQLWLVDTSKTIGEWKKV